jgi:hypothetical protein
MTWNYAEAGLGALLSFICAWSILQIARSGVVRGRMGGKWTRKGSPWVYWLSVSMLGAGLGAGVLLVIAALGASSFLAAAVAAATAAGSLIALACKGKTTKQPM